MSIREELTQFLDDDGVIVAEKAHEWAKKNPKSALYKSLEWNDAKAGYEYRLWQIRTLIRVHIINKDTGMREVVSLSIDRKNPGGGYRSMDDVLSSEDMTDILLRDALLELNRVEKKYKDLKALAGVWAAVARVKTKTEKKKGGRSKDKPEDRPEA